MKLYPWIHIGSKPYFEIGWFSGEPFKLIQIMILEIWESGGCAVFNIQIAKFCISLGW